MSSSEAGSALNSFGEAVDRQGKSFDPKMRQGMIAFAIDDFIKQFALHFPITENRCRWYRAIDFAWCIETLTKIESLLSLQIELDFGNKMHADTVIELLKIRIQSYIQTTRGDV